MTSMAALAAAAGQPSRRRRQAQLQPARRHHERGERAHGAVRDLHEEARLQLERGVRVRQQDHAAGRAEHGEDVGQAAVGMPPGARAPLEQPEHQHQDRGDPMLNPFLADLPDGRARRTAMSPRSPTRAGRRRRRAGRSRAANAVPRSLPWRSPPARTGSCRARMRPDALWLKFDQRYASWLRSPSGSIWPRLWRMASREGVRRVGSLGRNTSSDVGDGGLLGRRHVDRRRLRGQRGRREQDHDEDDHLALDEVREPGSQRVPGRPRSRRLSGHQVERRQQQDGDSGASPLVTTSEP